ncbi:sensor histidine kinase [Membranihabitans marinus]|uniref:sensor histidine kinase n=1 Tax=Membranihabitans marinus TaxID=1227546 RepID=UPI001F254FE3|nr:ATP-binding protein [Membranihabitans marinus]
MKLQNKLTLVFVLLTTLIQILEFLLIYHFARQYTEREFYNRLQQRVTIAAQTLLGEDELSVEIYEEIRRKHFQTLPFENEVIFQLDSNNNVIHEECLNSNYDPVFIDEIMNKGESNVRIKDTFFSGIYYHDNQGDFIIILSAHDVYGRGMLLNLRKILTVSFMFSLLITWLLGRNMANQALSPISRIVHKVNTISATNLHSRLEEPKNRDEVGELTVTFNDMLDRLETSFELQSNFVNNASHELRNPLTAILGQIEVALNKERSGEHYVDVLKGIETEALRLDNLVNGLLRLAHTDYENKGFPVSPVRIDEVIIDVKQRLDQANPNNKISLGFNDLPADESKIIVMGNRKLLEVAFHNILDNACKFSNNEKVLIKLVSQEKGLRVMISDDGIGIPPDDLKNIFEPFYRGSNARGIGGFGFGLPLAYRIIKMHHGQLRLSSQVGKGTIVKILLPNQFT